MITSKTFAKDGNMVYEVTTAPTTEPITVAELKMFARIDGSDEDTLLESFIEAARMAAERYLNRALIEQTVTLKMDFWPGEIIELPRPPLISITSVSTLDEDDTATAYDSDYYYAITTGIKGKIILKQGVTAPQNTERDYGGFQIVYKVGYGDEATDVPGMIREGIKLWATDIYENRVVRNEPPPEARTFFDVYRVNNI